MMTKFKEYSDIPVPVWLKDLGADGSWHNDAMPHAWIWVDEANFRGVDIWVNYDKPQDREIGTKFGVLLMESEAHYQGCSGEVLYEGEEDDAAIAAVNLGLERLGSPLRVGGPIPGVWTPWAEVLCRNCHDKLGDDVTAKRKVKWPEGKREGDGQGICSRCAAAVWVNAEIALLTRLRALVGGDLEQTGGMCAALVIGRTQDDGRVVVTNMDAPICVAIFAPGEWEEGNAEAQIYNLPGATPDDIAAAVIRVALNESLEGK